MRALLEIDALRAGTTLPAAIRTVRSSQSAAWGGTLAHMKYFSVLYMMPVEELQAWLAKPESERKEAEEQVKGEWDAWVAAHADAIKNTVALGATKRVSAGGVEDTNNGMMLSSYVEAESPEAAAELFKDHPHLKLPGATIEIMETRPM
jgi:hypothetical protein